MSLGHGGWLFNTFNIVVIILYVVRIFVVVEGTGVPL